MLSWQVGRVKITRVVEMDTPGHVSVLIESEGERAVITGDMTHHPCQLAHPAAAPSSMGMAARAGSPAPALETAGGFGGRSRGKTRASGQSDGVE